MRNGLIEINLDKNWALQDFSVYTKEYVQLYSFFYILHSATESGVEREFIYSTFQWRGGYSVVNFFKSAYSLTPEKDRLQIRKMQYASPGVLELAGLVPVATDIASLVAALCASVLSVSKTYDMVMRGYHQRKLARINIQDAKAKLEREEIIFVRASIKALAGDFNLRPDQIEALRLITKGNELIQLKILLALYRRAEPLQKQQSSGKAQL
ncbi:hypothetical protein YA0016_26355 [Pseudomonas syringae]|uniref:hypothetical protein n=1 Tax=Pseudomonas syringae group TaxID=136849 RepID=UPI000F03304A|nr:MULTISPECIES: hypothetical protein [Pseudomonas syringae group]MBI6845238.1 hypothetical protein [Pseudomonas syringae]